MEGKGIQKSWKMKAIDFVHHTAELHNARMRESADMLYARGIIESNYASLEDRLKDSEYIVHNLLVHAGIAITTVPVLLPGLSDAASSIAKEAWSISSLAYELMHGRYGNAGIHASVVPFCWIPRVGGLSYLLPLAAKDPEVALVQAYALSKDIVRKDPEQLFELIGSLAPVKAGVKMYDALRAHCLFDALGTIAHDALASIGNIWEFEAYPAHRYLSERSANYRVFDQKLQNIRYIADLVCNQIISPSFSRGARPQPLKK